MNPLPALGGGFVPHTGLGSDTTFGGVPLKSPRPRAPWCGCLSTRMRLHKLSAGIHRQCFGFFPQKINSTRCGIKVVGVKHQQTFIGRARNRLVLDSREDNIAGLVEHRQHLVVTRRSRSITDTESDTWFTTQASRLSGRTRTETGSSPTETASSHTGGVVAEKISSVAWATLQTSTSPSSVSVTEWTGADSQFGMDR